MPACPVISVPGTIGNSRFLYHCSSNLSRRARLINFRNYSRPLLHHHKQYSSSPNNADLKPDPSQWADVLTELPGQRKAKTKDVFVDDLHATLQAHRNTNRASIIRKIGHVPKNEDVRCSPVSEPLRKQVVDVDGPQKEGNLKTQAYLPESTGSTSTLLHTLRASEARLKVEPEPTLQKGWGTQKEKRNTRNGTTTEYIGRCWDPQGLWMLRNANDISCDANVDTPWLDHMERRGDARAQDAWSCLDEEIRAFERYMIPTLDEQAGTENCIDQVHEALGKKLPRNTLSIHGSRATGLADSVSDIDFSLAFPEFEKDPVERGPSATRPKAVNAAFRLLRKVKKALENSNQFVAIVVVNGHIPIAQAIHVKSGLKVQFQTLAATRPACEYTIQYVSEYPTLRALFLVIRQALRIRELDTVFTGGLGSYPLVMMIVNALKHAEHEFGSKDIGRQLLHVLRFYATADLYATGYSPDPPRMFPKRPGKMSDEELEDRSHDPHLYGIDHMRTFYPGKPWLLCLQDPADPLNDLGRKTTMIKHIQAVFAKTANRIETLMAAYGNPKHHQWDDLDTGLLAPLVRARYNAFEHQRRKVKGLVPPTLASNRQATLIRRLKL